MFLSILSDNYLRVRVESEDLHDQWASVRVWLQHQAANARTIYRAAAGSRDWLLRNVGFPAGLKWPLPRLTTPPHLPPWTVWRPRPLLRPPERRPSSLEACRGLRSPPQAGS